LNGGGEMDNDLRSIGFLGLSCCLFVAPIVGGYAGGFIFFVGVVLVLGVETYMSPELSSIDSGKSKNISRYEVLKVIGISAAWLLMISDSSKIYIGLSIAPIDTLAEFIGMLIVPCVPTYFLAKYIAKRNNKSIYKTWLICAGIALFLVTIGTIRRSINI
jgi:hypothetical protein